MRVNKNTFVNIKQFAHYIGRCRQTASRRYKAYLAALNKKEWQSLTVADIAEMDDLTIETVIIRIWN